ncbi:MAG TPA: hypothetical protein VNO70_14040 [Blastocatellia bacterium]|nr:hypothetical protein [Blastocatellia bacterium]
MSRTTREHPGRPSSLPGALLFMGLAVWFGQLILAANFGAAAQAAPQELTVTADFSGKTVAPEARLELRLSRPLLSPSESRIGMVIGQTDVSGLLTLVETSLSYNPAIVPLPLGESEVMVYVISSDGQWREVGRFLLRVGNEKEAGQKQDAPAPEKSVAEPEKEAEEAAKNQAEEKPAEDVETAPQEQAEDSSQGEASAEGEQAQAEQPVKKRFGFAKLDFVPSITIGVKSQPAQSTFPAANTPARATFTDATMQASFKSEMERGPFKSQSQFDLVGTSFRQEALRFGELGDEAPNVDLANYLMQFDTGAFKYLLGSVSYGTSRHLINNFSSRGMTLTIPLKTRGDFSLAAVNGTNIVGFGNFFGLNKLKHQLLSGTLGLELLPKRPGGLRLETSALSGYLLPVSSVNQADVNDAERSRGIGLRLVATDPAQRLRLDAGFARSAFFNPQDALLDQGADVVPVRQVTRSARYVDAGYDLLKDFALSENHKLNLTLNYKHEKVDPLYRSLGASTQADKIQSDFQALAAIGEVTAQFTHIRFNDNLANIASILKSLTRQNTVTLGVPLTSFIGDPSKPSPLIPRLSYTYNNTHQFGAITPVNGGFEDPSAVPDQVSAVHDFSSDWQGEKWRLGYKFNRSFQDNRQPGRERADLRNLVNGITYGMTPIPALELNFEVNFDSARNFEQNRTDRTLRFAGGLNWKMSAKATLTMNASNTLLTDVADTTRNRNIEFDTQWLYNFGLERGRFRKFTGQFFIRYANRYARNRDFIQNINDLQKVQTLNTGLSITFF